MEIAMVGNFSNLSQPEMSEVALHALARAVRSLHKFIDTFDPTMAAVSRRTIALLLEHPHRPADDPRWRLVAERARILNTADIGPPLFEAPAHAEVLASLYLRD